MLITSATDAMRYWNMTRYIYYTHIATCETVEVASLKGFKFSSFNANHLRMYVCMYINACHASISWLTHMQMQACIHETQINLWKHRLCLRLRFHPHCCRWLPLTTLDNTQGIQETSPEAGEGFGPSFEVTQLLYSNILTRLPKQ